ncbi:acyl-CoA dehydrogenase [Alteromonas sp. I4]|nr:acyl-CoA dehydrogenase [Alteromonas sp. I4]
MSNSAIDIDYLKTWEGKKQSYTDDMSPFKAKALHCAIDLSGEAFVSPDSGTDLPLPWHWLYFLDTPTGSNTGTDGHPKTGDFLPPVPLPRRMWAAGSFKCHTPLKLGVEAVKTSEIGSVELKQGSTGTLVFVTVLNSISQAGMLCIEEEQNLVYREMPTGPSPMPDGKQPETPAEWSDTVFPDPVLLFRFSALTFNGHRIHYDRQYAINEEFYPGLVVHGPLQALLLANSIALNNPNSLIDTFKFRAIRPVFDSKPLQICGVSAEQNVTLWTKGDDGFIGMTAKSTVVAKRVNNNV